MTAYTGSLDCSLPAVKAACACVCVIPWAVCVSDLLVNICFYVIFYLFYLVLSSEHTVDDDDDELICTARHK